MNIVGRKEGDRKEGTDKKCEVQVGGLREDSIGK